MKLAFLTPLLKNGTKSVGGGIAIDNKGFFEAWLSEDRSGAHHIDECVKCGFVFVVPVKLATFSAVGNKCVKRGGEHTEVANVHAVEVEEAEKGMQFS